MTKLNYFKITGIRSREVALLILIFDAWLFKLAVDATPKNKAKSSRKTPLPSEAAEVLLGLVDLDLEDIEVFVPPPLYARIKVTKVDGPHLRA